MSKIDPKVDKTVRQYSTRMAPGVKKGGTRGTFKKGGTSINMLLLPSASLVSDSV